MKIIFLSFFLFILPIYLYAQNFSIKEMETIVKLDVDKLDTFVTKKGYEFVKSEKGSFSNYLIYGFDEKDRNKYEHYISRDEFNLNERIMISFQTYKQEYYLNIKNDIEFRGYKFLNEETDENGAHFLNYSQKEFSLTLTSHKQKNDSQTFTSYEISIETN
jgi:hypothetical protein